MKLRPIAAAVVASLALPALAQQSTQIERVEITGSRILSPNAESPAPIQVLTAKDIAASGVANVQELLTKNPAIGVPGLSRTNSNFLTSSGGVATIDLRNLGADRTLVLINGHRVVSGVPTNTQVDLNTIPTDFIERVEIMTGGASSTYGSDAVAGVVNIILKRNFNGLNLNAQVGQSWKQDDKEKQFSATWGTSNDRDSVMVHLGLTREGEVRSADRDTSAIDQSSIVADGNSTDPADLFKGELNLSGFAPAGRFKDTAGHDFTYDANGNQIDWNPDGTNGVNRDGVGARGFNRSAYRRIAVPVDRLLLATKGEHALTDNHRAFFEATYANSKSSTEIEPYPLNSTSIYKDGKVPVSFDVNGTLTRNPLVPATITGPTYTFTKRMSDFGPRHQDANRDMFRVITGLKGELTSSWSYDSFVGYGFTKEAQHGTGQVNVLNFRNALEVIPTSATDPTPICRDATARAQGCVPADIFGIGKLSAAAVQYIQAPQSLETRATQKMAGFSLTGEAFQLPAGAVDVATGAEWRKEAASTIHDALTAAGLNAGNKIPDTSGSYDVREAFIEARLPILSKLPAVKSLDGTVAYRLGDYSTVGHTNSWNLGMDWAANSTFRVRLTGARSMRAPNVGELYQAPSQTFPTVSDPCLGVKATDTGVLADRCKAAPGVAENIATNGGTFKLTQADRQGVSGYDGGNPSLEAEKGTSTTLGIVVTPKDFEPLKNFSFTADYFDIKIAKAINFPGRQYVLDQCYNGGDQSFCRFITRRPTLDAGGSSGALTYIDQIPENSGGQRIRGLDITSSYSEKLGPGRVNGRLSWTHTFEEWTKATDDAEKDNGRGEIGSPINKWTLNLGYDFDKWSISTTTTYIGESYLDDQFQNQFLSDPVNYPNFTKDSFKVGAKTYFDFQTSYQWGKASLYFGVNNLFNTKAPPIISGLPGDTTGTETNASTYDAIGRRYYAGVRLSM